MNKPTVLITGACGFVGHNLWLKFNESGYPVLGIDALYKPSSKANLDYLGQRGLVDSNFLECNVVSADALSFMKQAEYIIYGAVVELYTAEQYPVMAYRENVMNFTQFLFNLNHWKDKLKRLIFLSSTAVYGNPHNSNIDFTENNPYNPLGVYANTKMLQEQILIQLATKLEIPITILRLTNVYSGDHNSADIHRNVIFKLIDQSFRGESFPVWDNGTQTRDYVHIEDVYSAIKLSFEDSGTGNIYNLGTNRQVSMNQIVAKAQTLLNCTPIYKKAELSFVKNRKINTNKFYSAFGWKPSINILEGGLELAVEEYRQRYKI